ncbi:heat shock protein DnaJ [Candidatus Thiomargarita nelsonii]|uniref:Heat shock protein DnaJ n=1 Tax=Candidatus Thiomargarita nelsonii TaxID=1003181 RepID=A0A176S1A3_9GAMM|nr:heat shock protein DnaJ [Candidatus Thiomargarita nelsonii]
MLLIVLGAASFAGWKYLYKPLEPIPAPVFVPEQPKEVITPPLSLEQEDYQEIEEQEVIVVPTVPQPVAEEEPQPDEQAIEEENALAEQENAKQAQIANLLRECQTHLDANRLTTGRQGTALVCYREVLKLEADNAEALDGLQEIERRYKQWAENAFRTNKLNKVRQYVKRLEMVNPQSSILAELRQRLENER